MTRPTEPTLICSDHIARSGKMVSGCSEVVERLAKCSQHVFKLGNGYCDATFDRQQATTILHEWREQIRKGAKHD